MAAGIARKCAINVSFSGCGFLGMYHIGVLARLKEGQDSEQDPFAISSALGASAGALGKDPDSLMISKHSKCQQIYMSINFVCFLLQLLLRLFWIFQFHCLKPNYKKSLPVSTPWDF